MAVSLGNPVEGIIAAKGEPYASGQMRVIRTFQDHIDAGDGGGIDIGNGTCGFKLLAQEDGKVSAAFTVTSGKYAGAKIVRYRLTKYPDLEPAIAHMDLFEVKVGQVLTRGQVIGHAGRSGNVPCHLHLGMKKNINGVWTEIDSWDLLAQNQPESDMLQGTFVEYVHNRKTVVQTASTASNANWREGPRLNATIIRPVPDKTPVIPDMLVNGDSAAGSTKWYGCWLDNGHGVYAFGYFHESVLAPLVPDETIGVPQATYDSLLNRFNGVKKKVADNAADIAND
jgi:hypothetical protein